MIREALEYLHDIAPTKVYDLYGKQYAEKELRELPSPRPEPEPMLLHTLDGLLEFLAKEWSASTERVMVHVESPVSVAVRSPLQGDFAQRMTYARAKPFLPVDKTNGYMDLDAFAVYVQTHFVPTENTALILQLLGNMQAGTTAKYADDGVSQTISTRRGVASLETVKVPSPIDLQPFRTFHEVPQPVTKYVLRLRGDDDPQAALIETNDNSWQTQTVTDIANYLLDKRPDLVVVA